MQKVFQNCGAAIRYRRLSRTEPPICERGMTLTHVLHGPYGQRADSLRQGRPPEGKQRYRVARLVFPKRRPGTRWCLASSSIAMSLGSSSDMQSTALNHLPVAPSRYDRSNPCPRRLI
jgi:hypothetical protein